VRAVNTEDVLRLLHQHGERDPKVSAGLELLVRKAAGRYRLYLEDPDSFLALIWQEISGCRLLATGGARTLRDVVQRMKVNGWTFADLARNLDFGSDYHSPDWFAACLTIEADFEWQRFGHLLLTPPCDVERRQSPRGTFYIKDGNHKALVLAHHLVTGRVEYRPIEAIMLVGTPEELR
jgi:hypothetical protein